MPRSLDTSLPDDPEEVVIDLKKLPLECQIIPPSVLSLKECARFQIEELTSKSTPSEEEEDALEDGFILCDLNIVEQKMRAWRRLFPRVKPFFALKCNPDVMVAAVIGQFTEESGYDCASLSEIRLALQSTGKDPTKCIYANPQKAEAELDAALAVGVECVTFDSNEELHKVHAVHHKRCETLGERPPPEMVVRLLVPDSHSTVPLGEKFGAPPSRVEQLTMEAMELGLPVVGVSFHCGSGCHDPTAFGNAIKLALEAMNVIDRVQEGKGIKCSLLDLGGGYPGFDGDGGDFGRFSALNPIEEAVELEDEQETAAKIAHEVVPLLDKIVPKDGHIDIISEPGRYFVEAAFALCSRIYSVRVERDEDGKEVRHYYIAQGVQGVFKDVVLCNETFIPLPLKMTCDEGTSDASTVIPSAVHGPSGEDYDIVCERPLPELNIGDWLIWDRMGAYTLSIAARSGLLPIRYVLGGR